MRVAAFRLPLLAALSALALSAAAQEKFTFLTNWYAQAEHGGFYQAVATGIYKKYGLDVTVKMGGPQVNIMQLMAAGQTDCIMGSSDMQMMVARDGGLPVGAARDEIAPHFHVHADLLKRAPNLLIVSSNGAGFDPVDVDACTAAGVAVVNQAGGNAVSVAEMAIADYNANKPKWAWPHLNQADAKEALRLLDTHVRDNAKKAGLTFVSDQSEHFALYTDADLPFDMAEATKAVRLMRIYEADIVSAYRFDRTGEGARFHTKRCMNRRTPSRPPSSSALTCSR